VLALSGLHLGIVYWLVVLLTAGRRHSIIVQVATVLAIWAYAFLTGLAPSIVRAALMLSLYSLLAIGHRDKMSVNALAFAAIAI
jgi:competence protein ComEC